MQSTRVARGVFRSCRSVWVKFIPLCLLYLPLHCPLITEYQYTMLKIPDVVDVVDVSTSEYATRRKNLLKLVKQLRAMGYGRFICVCTEIPHNFFSRAQADLDLPRVTVIGNQSAGRSRLSNVDSWICS